jgi:hypothetical protein
MHYGEKSTRFKVEKKNCLEWPTYLKRLENNISNKFPRVGLILWIVRESFYWHMRETLTLTEAKFEFVAVGVVELQ